MRRLTRFEYENTVRQLLAEPTFQAAALPADDRLLGFDNNVEAQAVSAPLVEIQLELAEQVSMRAVQRLPQLTGCDAAAPAGDPCIRRFVQTFGQRGYRRPLQDREVARLMDVFAAGRTTDAATGVKMVLQVILQSPHFLYRVERQPLGGWDLASRLSYLIWGSMPDEELFVAASSGTLDSRAGLAAQARRMIADPRARGPVARFHRQWLGLEVVSALDKDPKIYPSYRAETWPLLKEEVDRTLADIVWTADGGLDAILTNSSTFLDQRLATFYGISGPSGNAFERVMLDPSKRAGVLTGGALMAALADTNQSSPIRRGVFVREDLLCQELPPPPDNVDVKPPMPDPSKSTRERFAEHRVSAACSGCHSLIDPIGLGFEGFDGIGRTRTKENGISIDARGDLTGTDVDGSFDGAVELTTRLARSQVVRSCYVKQWFRFAQGRAEGPADRCSLAQAETAFETGGRRVQGLLLALTQTDAFQGRAGGLR